MKAILQKWGLPALTLCTFFFLLGSRSLNQPDEGRYSEIAREMIETGNWLVPHFWYLPHLDKPPMTYWLVAASMKLFGQNEWAVRLPVALAGISGVWAVFLLGCSHGRAACRLLERGDSAKLAALLRHVADADAGHLPDTIRRVGDVFFLAKLAVNFGEYASITPESGTRQIFFVEFGRLGCCRAWIFDERADRPGYSSRHIYRIDHIPPP